MVSHNLVYPFLGDLNCFFIGGRDVCWDKVYDYIPSSYVYWLVVRKTILKNMIFVNGKDDIPYMKWNIENV